MKRLIQRGLMFGSLIEVSSPALVERTNRALKHSAGKVIRLWLAPEGFTPSGPPVGYFCREEAKF